MGARHLRGCPEFVEKNQAIRIDDGLRQPPIKPPFGHIGPVLLCGMNHFF
jgi:hypothetical protein